MSKEHLLEIKITQPGRIMGQYRPIDVNTLRLESALTLNHVQNGSPQRNVIHFPYPAEHYFRAWFEAARRCMAVLPIA
ncbi:MAG: hypothetical protein JW862_12800 [Anaerolineales bacterium]|nr:hypothetical protein [Anaerolineales bacterium]